ncbi:MAG: SurA N-terminal domain-containing protein [bacterium]
MGLMNSMRNRGGLLVGVIAFAIVAFLAGDVLMSGQNIFGGMPTSIGEINGVEIKPQEFQVKLDQNIENYKRNTGGNAELNETMTGYMVDQTWNQSIYDVLLQQKLEKSGVTVTSVEMTDMISGTNPHPEVRRAFTNPQTGMFDAAQVKQYLQSLTAAEADPANVQQWMTFQTAIKEERTRAKYLNLVKAGLYTPTMFAKADYMEKNKTVDVKYVLLDYATVSDSSIQVSESDLSSYYNSNKYKYKQNENTRSFEYIALDLLPSKDDTVDAQNWIIQQLAGLQAASDDSTYINLNAETKYLGAYNKKGELAPALDSIMFSKGEGFIYGPYFDNNAYKIAKLISVKSLPDSVRARHILIQPANGDAVAGKKTADSILALINNGADFGALAMQYSTDGSKEKGGDLGYFDSKAMVKPFSDFCFNETKGKKGVVASQFGFHVIEITDQKNFSKQVSVGVIDRSITPSNSTAQALFAKANALASSIKTAKEFEAADLSGGFAKRVAEEIKENDRFITGLESPREVVRWAFKADKGDVSPLFEVGNKFVVAHLTKVKNKGTIPMEYIKTELESAVRKEKKAEMLMEKMKAASASNIDQLAQKLGTVSQMVTGINFAFPVVPGIAREPEVVGTIFGSEKGKFLTALKGEKGVYAITIENINEALPLPEYNSKKADTYLSMKSRVDNEFLEGLKRSAKIKDNRVMFY